MNDSQERVVEGRPSVTVVIPTRDRPQLLSRAIESVLAQDYKGSIECVVVFDRGSPASPPHVSREGRTVAVIRNGRTPGPAGARNAGADAATGELLAFCDDDDEWLPSKLDTQVRALRSHAEAGVATCGLLVNYRNRLTTRLPASERITLPHLIRSRSTAVHTSTLLLRRDDFLDRIGPFDEEMPEGYGEDYEWLLRAAQWKPLVAVLQALVRIDWHDASWFDAKWDTIIAGIGRLLEKHPDIGRDPVGLSRLYGRLAFAHAAAGRDREARLWARRCIALNWWERRAYLALAVSLGLIPAHRVLELAHRTGRGI
jgi:glycosyltransferase involved in cell wall biosynthesis